MIIFEDKKIIKDAIKDLEPEVENKPVIDFALDNKSLYAWKIYQQFVSKIINNDKFKEDYKKLEDIYNFLEIDKFSISANNDLDKELEKLKGYIKKISEKI